MLKRLSHLFLFALLSCSFLSCTPLFYKFFGVKILKEFDDTDYTSTVNRLLDLYSGDVHTIVSSDSLFREFDKNFQSLGEKNLIQPIQMLYFHGDSLISYRANCHAHNPKWSGNLTWNYNGEFDVFPPIPAFTLDQDSPNLEALSKIYTIRTASDGYTIVFFWSTMLKRQSFEAYKQLTESIDTADPVAVNLINIDNFYIALSE